MNTLLIPIIVMWGGLEDEVNTNTLEDKFSDISYVDFYSRVIKSYMKMNTELLI